MIDGVLEGSEGRAGDRAGRCQLEMAIGQSNCIAGNLVGGGGSSVSGGNWCSPVYKATGHSGLLLKPRVQISKQSEHAKARQRQAQEIRILTSRRDAEF